MKFYNLSLEYRNLILLLGSLYSALLLFILISLSLYNDALKQEYATSLHVVAKSLKHLEPKQIKSEFLSQCNPSDKGDCDSCSLTKKCSSIVIEYYEVEDEIPNRLVSQNIQLKDNSFISLSICPAYMKMQLHSIKRALFLTFFGIAIILTILIIFLNKKLFYALKCLVNLCNDTTEQSDTVSYCPCSYEIKDLRDAITKLLIKNQSLFEKKSDMFKEIAHELKSPIAIMQARLSLLSVDDTPSNVQKYINDTDEDIEDVKNIIYELLFLEEIEMEIQNTHKSDISMKTECELMQGKFGPILELNDIEVDAPWNDDFKIYTFKHSIRKVLQAVYENVFIHTQKGSTICVEVDAKNKTMFITNEAKSLEDRESTFKSTKIGTKIIQRLSEKLDFTFSTELKDNIYTTTIIFHS